MSLSISKTANSVATETGTTITATFASTIAAGSTVAVVCCYIGTLGAGTCADSAAGAYTQGATFTGSGWTFTTFYYVDHPGGASVVTFTPPSSVANKGIDAFEIASSTGAISHVGSAGQYMGFPGTGTDAVTTGNIATTTQADGLVVASSLALTSNLWSVGTGYTSSGTIWNNYGQSEYRVLTSPGTYAATMTLSAAVGAWIAGLVFEETGGGATAEPTVSAAQSTAHDPAISVGASILATLSAVLCAAISPMVSAGTSIVATETRAQFEAPSPVVSAGASVLVDASAATVAAFDPSLATGAAIWPTTSAIDVDAPDPAAGASASVLASASSIEATAPDPGLVSVVSVSADASRIAATAVSPAVTAGASQPGGGWGWWDDFSAHRQRSRARERAEKDRRREIEQIERETDREIASLLHQQDIEAEQRIESARLIRIAENVAAKEASRQFTMQVIAAASAAAASHTAQMAQRFYREMRRMADEEEAAVVLALLTEDID